MNAGSLMISFVIGGILLVAILSFNVQLMSNTQEVALTSYARTNLNNVVEILDNDFNKIGFNAGNAVPFTIIDNDRIIFQADVFDNDSYGSTDIEWYLDTSDPVTTTTNPNDYYLKRVGPYGTSSYGTLKFPVSQFRITYYTANGTVTYDKTAVKKIEVELIIESGEPYSINKSNVEYPRLVWKRIYVPNNINLPY